MKLEEMRSIVEAGIEKHMACADALWPPSQWQLHETNLILYVSNALLNEGFSVVSEWPVGRSAKHLSTPRNRIDLVAYHKGKRGKALLLGEAKRYWGDAYELWSLEEQVGRLIEHAGRLESDVGDGKGKGKVTVEAEHKFGLVLVSASGSRTELEPASGRGRVGHAMTSIKDKTGKFQTIRHRNPEYPYVVHYALWSLRR
ncbi:MAG: hypothetical protein IT381_32360 [Deltaproteobacteria bacterium]|nr:hypothetical protein [Deltaproteobacteria bacterium]